LDTLAKHSAAVYVYFPRLLPLLHNLFKDHRATKVPEALPTWRSKFCGVFAARQTTPKKHKHRSVVTVLKSGDGDKHRELLAWPISETVFVIFSSTLRFASISSRGHGRAHRDATTR
jgi:hypothetical protein